MSEPSFASLEPTLLARKGGAKPAMRPQLAAQLALSETIDEEQLEDLGWNDMGDADCGESEIGAMAFANGDMHADGRGGSAPATAAPSNIVPLTRPALLRVANEAGGDAGPDADVAARSDETRSQAEDTAPEKPGDAAAADELVVRTRPRQAKQHRDNDLSSNPLAGAAMPLNNDSGGNEALQAKRANRSRKSASRSRARRSAFTLRLDSERHLKLRLAATMRDMSAQALVTEALDMVLARTDFDALTARFRPN